MWYVPNDTSKAIITASEQINSAHHVCHLLTSRLQVGRVAKRGVVVFGYEEATLGQGRLQEKVIAGADPKPTVALVSVVAKGERQEG